MKLHSAPTIKAAPVSQHQRVVVVTGGSRGVGRATCIKAAALGFAVVVNYRSNTAAAASGVRHIQSTGGRATPVRADISSEASVRRLFNTADRAFGPVSALFNNACAADNRCAAQDIDRARLDR